MFFKPPLFRKRRRETEAPDGPPGNRAGPLTTAADTDSQVEDQLMADEVSIEYIILADCGSLHDCNPSAGRPCKESGSMRVFRNIVQY